VLVAHVRGEERFEIGPYPFFDGARTSSAEVSWQGTVYVFELAGHPEASTAYAWEEEAAPRAQRLVAVLHVPPVASPADAVRAHVRDRFRDFEGGKASGSGPSAPGDPA
jgi:hypothetical protein